MFDRVVGLLKKILIFIYIKYHRVIYFFKYRIPVNSSKVDDRLIGFLEWVGPIKSAAIIGKGASILQSNPKELIQGCDFKCVMNTADMDYLRDYVGDVVDAQMTTHISQADSLMPVFSKKVIDDYKIKVLICNSTKCYQDGVVLKNYWDYFNGRVQYISYMADDSKLHFSGDAKRYGGHGLGITANLLRMLYEVETLEKIVFAGIDAFHFNYAYRSGVKKGDKIFYGINEASKDPLNTHGIPFLKFLFYTLGEINMNRRLEVWFPTVLREYIDFPDESYYRFYN